MFPNTTVKIQLKVGGTFTDSNVHQRWVWDISHRLTRGKVVLTSLTSKDGGILSEPTLGVHSFKTRAAMTAFNHLKKQGVRAFQPKIMFCRLASSSQKQSCLSDTEYQRCITMFTGNPIVVRLKGKCNSFSLSNANSVRCASLTLWRFGQSQAQGAARHSCARFPTLHSIKAMFRSLRNTA